MAKNAYAKRLDAARAAREYAIRRYTRQQMLDFVTIALGRMGYGEKRLKDFEQTLSAVYIEFAEAFTDEGDVVIDPCCGSGATLRAARELNRPSYGFEIDRVFYQRARDEMLRPSIDSDQIKLEGF